MSNRRDQILPGAGVWDSFYDKKVQSALDAGRWSAAAQGNLSVEASMELLAWPIIAFTAADELAQDQATKITRQVKFLQAYAEEPSFVAKVLEKVTGYHCLKETEKLLPRQIVEISNRCSNPPSDILKGDDAELYNWKEIVELLGVKNSVSHLKTEFHREKKRRLQIGEEWSKNFQAWNDLTALRARTNASILPLMAISLRG
jgi:hypothetical protein